ncbi:MAG: histidine kinase [Microgenomates group bacterium GW2011_GWC1_37_8]|uniref:histidine kinase n=1 Tax=Candidatus Woesebacteria bacterium GW2011_GWB1_38_8 TaxID=1618570 RepID=A0A0G0NHU6_9BACT|nr:MAG: histidine kinase [Microgenomates group bacterium GW2011_GWC1_37_8]KKQ85479.1 MAG: histidine kinase [Candidatus Woesebacteria bacterium GW2011_GWB1_38_8]
MKPFKNLRGKLFFWYITSLITVTAFFYFAVHIYSLPYRNIIFFALLIFLALEGFFIVRKMTDGLSKLSSKIKTITSKNLSEKVIDIESEDEIGELASAFNQLLDRLLQAFKRERQFIGDVAHELKTPLSTQRSGIEVALSKDRSAKELKSVLIEALSDNNRIASTLKNILDLAWSEAESEKVNKDKVKLSEVVSEIVEIATKLGKAKKVNVSGNISQDIVVLGSEDKLFRALLNITDNAIKYTPTSGSVNISLTKKNSHARFRVKDTGVGISKNDLPHIFERFYRGSRSGKVHGAGLGLAISQALISAHKGTIDVKSDVGKGTTITAYLPLH